MRVTSRESSTIAVYRSTLGTTSIFKQMKYNFGLWESMNKLLKSVLKDLLYIRLCRNKNLSNQICVGLIVDSVLFVLITHNHYVVCSYDVWLWLCILRASFLNLRYFPRIGEIVFIFDIFGYLFLTCSNN